MADTPALARLRERLRAASAGGTPLRLRGCGSKDFLAEQLRGDLLELGDHRGIVSYEPSELVITARCGTPLAEVAQVLAEQGQELAFDPPRFGPAASLGGVIASGLSGPGRLYRGAVRDFVLGARLLDAQGEELRFGGEVMKNVAGFDVARLLCGSFGILGVISEVSLKVLPRPRARQTLRLDLAAPEAVAAFNRWAGMPLPLAATAWHQGAAWVQLAGAESAIAAARAQIGGEPVDDERACAFWHGLRDLTLPFFAGRPLWRVSVPATSAALPLADVPLIEGGGAVRWYAGPPPGCDVRAAAVAGAGTALCFRGDPGTGPRFHPLPAALLSLHRRLKERFDPAGIFNRGRLVAEL